MRSILRSSTATSASGFIDLGFCPFKCCKCFRAACFTGKGRETLALPPPEPTQRVTYHPYSAPLHRIKTDNMLPMQLLTPFQVKTDAVDLHTS